MELYHGSPLIIEFPDLKKGKVYNDYGRGFYCTEHMELAKEWAVESEQDGFVNCYQLDVDGLNILNLNDRCFSILHWLTVLLEHRDVRMNTALMRQGQDYLVGRYHVDLSSYDIIIGYRADDSYFSFVRGFLSNSISLEQLQQAMYLGKLGEQYCLRTEAALEKLQFAGIEIADYQTYYPKRKYRDQKARAGYEALVQMDYLNETYLIDLMRGDN